MTKTDNRKSNRHTKTAVALMEGRVKGFALAELVYFLCAAAAITVIVIIGLRLLLLSVQSAVFDAFLNAFERDTAESFCMAVLAIEWFIYAYVTVAILSSFSVSRAYMLKSGKEGAGGAAESLRLILKGIKLGFLKTARVFLWGFLLVIPGIEKMRSYSTAEFILAENPDLSAKEALARSEELMRGKAEKYFAVAASTLLVRVLASVLIPLWLYAKPFSAVARKSLYEELKTHG